MIKIIFKCDKCKHEVGRIQAWDRDVVVECDNCRKLETVDDDKKIGSN